MVRAFGGADDWSKIPRTAAVMPEWSPQARNRSDPTPAGERDTCSHPVLHACTMGFAPNHESACRRKGRSQRQKMEPGAMHGPTRIPILQMLQTVRYVVSRIDGASAVKHFR